MKRNSNGQMLIEVMFALAIALLVSFGLIRSIIYSVNNSNFAKDQSQATDIANRKMAEYVDGGNKSWYYFTSTLQQDEVVEDKFCVRNTFTESALSPSGKMERISVDIFWGEKSAGTLCKTNYYSHSQHFETYVTN